jgi:hypothetical protein
VTFTPRCICMLSGYMQLQGLHISNGGWSGGGGGGGKTDGISGFVSSILFMCGLGQHGRCSDLLGPADSDDRIVVRERYSAPN